MGKKNQNFGFSLVELLVAVAILGIITGAVTSAHALHQRAYRESEMAAEITQNGRVILERMVREIRQAKAMAVELSDEREGTASEILFQDGHLPSTFEAGQVQGTASTTITLASTASSEDDYYEGMFITVIHPTYGTQTRKIVDYNGGNQVAEVETPWDTIPTGWDYQIDSSCYYIHYYRDNQNNVWRRIVAYCLLGEWGNCADPLVFVAWNSASSKKEVVLEEPRIIGQYVSQLEFWGKKIINIALTLAKNGKTLNLETKVFGRNL